MATRSKTIEFATTVDTATLAAATLLTKTITIYIPETVVGFDTVTMRVHCRHANATAVNATAPVLGISDDGATWSDSTLANPIAQSGESESWDFQRDVTSLFQTGAGGVGPWSGTSATWSVRFSLSGVITQNHSFKLIITYRYDDTSSTHIKTVRIPIESTRRYATTSWQTLGGATAIPAITGGYLPEDSVVIRQAFLELIGTNGQDTTATVSETISIRVNGGTTRTLWYAEQALSGNCQPIYATYDITSEDTYGSARSLEILTDSTLRGAVWVGGWLTVTYEFVPADTTTVLNSILIGGVDTVGAIPGTAVGDTESWGRDIFIEEPATITLKESAIVLFFQAAAPNNASVYVACGDQSSYTQYQQAANSGFELGSKSIVHRIDAGGQNGVAFESLARGRNAYELRMYASANGVFWNLSGFLLLNYTSGKATDGVGVHSQSRHFLWSANSTGTVGKVTVTTPCAIAESSYWLTGACVYIFATTDNSTNQGYGLSAERKAGEGEGEGWEPLYSGQTLVDNENQWLQMWGSARRAWKRHEVDLDAGRMDIEAASRTFVFDTNPSTNSTYGLWATWHGITFEVAGDISGSNGGTVDLFLHRASDKELLEATSRVGDGAYSFDWHDDTEEVYVVAYEDDTHTGVSARDVGT